MGIAFIFILAGIAFFIFAIKYKNNKNSLQGIKTIYRKGDEKRKKKLTNLWGITGVYDQIITINKNQHSIVVELESIEYCLLHEGEKQSVDRELMSISQMLKYPIQFLEVKNQIELGEMLEEIKLNIINSNSNIKEYANALSNHLQQLQKNKNLFERKNYMIISSFNDRKTAEIELKQFYHVLRYHLLNIKVNSRLLQNKEIVELIYEQLHKGNKNQVSEMDMRGGLAWYVSNQKRKKNKAI